MPTKYPQPADFFWQTWNELSPEDRADILSQATWRDLQGNTMKYDGDDIKELSQMEFGQINGTNREFIRKRVSRYLLEQLRPSGERK